jgi:hypothetical protein
MSERLQCDLVMRGGITSGIVYPRAIAKLAETYDFRSIGGTSGAIAAAATAAAALGAKGGENHFQSDIKTLSGTLATKKRGKTVLERLFQPQPSTYSPSSWPGWGARIWSLRWLAYRSRYARTIGCWR